MQLNIVKNHGERHRLSEMQKETIAGDYVATLFKEKKSK